MPPIWRRSAGGSRLPGPPRQTLVDDAQVVVRHHMVSACFACSVGLLRAASQFPACRERLGDSGHRGHTAETMQNDEGEVRLGRW